MKNKLLFIFLLFVGMRSYAQTSGYVLGGLNATTGLGYKPFAWTAGAGISDTSRHLFFDSLATYDAAKKLDTGDGHSLKFRSQGYFRVSQTWMLGGGISYTKLFTSEYEKSAWRPRVGGGALFGRDGRFTADYVFSANDSQNGLRGIDFILATPSYHGLFFQEDIGVYFFHATFNPTDHRHGADVQMLVGYRF